MDFKHKLLILVIIIVAFIILYRLNRENQEIKKYINEFEWIIKVLDSCKTRSQALVSVELFKIFKKRWDKHLR